MIHNPIPLSDPDAHKKLDEACQRLGRRNRECPLSILQWLSLKTEEPDFLYDQNFLRIQDYLRRFLSKSQLDSSWIRGIQAESFFGGLMGGTPTGSGGGKQDLISKRKESVSVKVYSDSETRIQSGNISQLDERTTLDSFLRGWHEAFIDRNRDSNNPDIVYLKHSYGRTVRCPNSPGQPLINLVAMVRKFPRDKNWRQRYKDHLRYRRAWKKILRRTFKNLQYWLVLYISENAPRFDGYIEIDWFTNHEVLNYLSPLDRPAPITVIKKAPSCFRFSAGGLKKGATRLSKTYKSGIFYCSRLLQINAAGINDVIKKRTKGVELIESLRGKHLDRSLRLLGELCRK